MAWRGGKYSAIGLDIGGRSIKAMQLRGEPGDWQVIAAAAIPRPRHDQPLDAAELARLRDALDRQGFRGRRVVLTVPPAKAISGMLELPPANSGAPMQQIARMELASMHRVDPSALAVAYWELPTAGRHRETARVMAAACLENDADELLDLFESQKMEVAALDIHAAAMMRGCCDVGFDPRRVTALLELGWNSALLVIVFQDMIVYERRLAEQAIKNLWETLKKRFDFDDDVVDLLISDVGLADQSQSAHLQAAELEDVRKIVGDHFRPMVAEVRTSLGYAAHEYSDVAVNSVMLIGGGAAIPGLAADLAAESQLEVRPMSPARRVTVPAPLATICSNPALTVAMGLAMHEEGWRS